MLKYEEYNPPIRDQQAWNEYVSLVEELRKTAPTEKKPKDGCERHHIIAQCYLKTKEERKDPENIIIVSPKDHFRLHILYKKAVGGKMAYALKRMIDSKQNGFKEDLTPEEYESLRQEVGELSSQRFKGRPSWSKGKKMTPEYCERCRESTKAVWEREGYRDKQSEAHKGFVMPEERKERISKKLRGRVSPMKGKPHPMKGKHVSIETREKQKIAHRNISEGTRRKMSESAKKRFSNPEERLKASIANKGKKPWCAGKNLSPEHCKKISENKMGNTNWLGKHHSEETKKKISESSRGNTNVRGRVYIHKENVRKRVYKEELDSFLEDGWELGIGKRKS